MTLVARIDVPCGHCGQTSEQAVLRTTNAFGSPDLDFRPPEMRRSTMDTWLQLCPHCGYCAADLSQPPADAAVLQSEPYRMALQRQDVPELARRFLAYAVASRPSDPAGAARAFVHAAWVCDDAGRVEQAAECRQRAAEGFRRCKPFADNEQDFVTGAILVDVLRRCGQFAEASSECVALLAAQGVPGVLPKVLQFQQRLIAQADTGVYRIADTGACQDSDGSKPVSRCLRLFTRFSTGETLRRLRKFLGC